jgi:hypothetical protein
MSTQFGCIRFIQFFVLLLVSFVFYVAFNASSMTGGIFFAMLCMLFLANKRFPMFKGSSSALFLLGAVIFHLVISLISDIHDISVKRLLSFLLLSAVLPLNMV